MRGPHLSAGPRDGPQYCADEREMHSYGRTTSQGMMSQACSPTPQRKLRLRETMPAAQRWEVAE